MGSLRIAPIAWLALAVLVVLWLARPVIGPFLVAGVIAYAFSPLVGAGQARTGWPRVVIVGIGYLALIALLAVLVAILAPRASRELASLAESGPDSFATTLRQVLGTDAVDVGGHRITIAMIAQAVDDQIQGIVASPGDAAHVATEVGAFALDALLTLIVAFYLLVDGARFLDRSLALVPPHGRERAVEILGHIHVVLGRWLRGQLLLIALVATVVYVGLGPVLHLPYALAIGLLTGVLEIIPLVGPAIAAAIAGTDAFARGGVGLAATVLVFFFVLRQVEDQLVMPIVVGRVVHLHPVVTIFAVLVGLSTYGVLGGLLGVPVAAAANVIFNELYPVPDAAPPPGPGAPPERPAGATSLGAEERQPGA